jgi:hypothetical protein
MPISPNLANMVWLCALHVQDIKHRKAQYKMSIEQHHHFEVLIYSSINTQCPLALLSQCVCNMQSRKACSTAVLVLLCCTVPYLAPLTSSMQSVVGLVGRAMMLGYAKCDAVTVGGWCSVRLGVSVITLNETCTHTVV